MRLLESYRLGPLTLKNRVVMAPMTRSRAPEQVPGDLNATYYAQRAGAGLIISEGTQVSALGAGYPWTPGIHTDEQAAGWRKVTDAVHAADGLIFAQLWHVGRMGHPTVHGGTPVAPSAIAPGEDIFTSEGMQPIPTPHELTCPDEEYVDEPEWLNTQLSCFSDFGPEAADTGSYKLPARGVLHPSLAEVPGELLASSPGGLRVEVRGQLDHPDSRGCTSHWSDPGGAARVQLRCRTTFVITELRAAD